MIYEVAIIGDGLAGLITCNIIQDKHKIALFAEKKDDKFFDLSSHRTIALNYRNWKKILELMPNLQDELSPGIIENVVVTSNTINSHINYEAEKFFNSESEKFGVVLEYNNFVKSMYSLIKADVYSKLINIIDQKEYFILTDDGGKEIKARKVIIADGKNSKASSLLNLPEKKHEYGFCAYMLTIEHEFNHENYAFEHFYQDHVVATLPLLDSNKSTMVHLFPKSNNIKTEEIISYLACFIGKIKNETNDFDNAFVYDLAYKITNDTSMDKVVCIGDAHQSINPLAGQGFNLAIKNIFMLCEEMDFVKYKKSRKTFILPIIIHLLAGIHTTQTKYFLSKIIMKQMIKLGQLDFIQKITRKVLE